MLNHFSHYVYTHVYGDVECNAKDSRESDECVLKIMPAGRVNGIYMFTTVENLEIIHTAIGQYLFDRSVRLTGVPQPTTAEPAQDLLS